MNKLVQALNALNANWSSIVGEQIYANIQWIGEPIAESVINAKIAELEAVRNPNWEALIAHVLGGELYPMYARLTGASFAPSNPTLAQIANANNIAVAAGKIDQSVQVTRVEGAVAASFALLASTSDYQFTQQEKDDWNRVTEELGFSELVRI